MSVVSLLPALFSGCVQGGAVGYDDVIAAVRGGVPDWFVFPHEQDCYSGGEAAERGRLQLEGLGGREGSDCREGEVGSAG